MEKLKKVKLPLFFLLSFIVFTPIINAYLKILEHCFNMKSNNGLAVIIWALVSFIVILITKNITITRENAKIEVEGINLKKKDGTFGTADWGTKEEIQEYLSINKRDGIILGETEEQEVITLPMNTYLNKNIAVFGSSGSGKSVGFAIPNRNGISTRRTTKNSKSKYESCFY